MAAQYEIVTQAEKAPNQATKKVAFFDAEGDPVDLAGGAGAGVGTRADLDAGTDETPVLWSAKDLAEYIASVVAG